ncbi:MAG: DUF4143 domain-containing protein [Longimicrobiales bacterium]
MDRRLAGMGAVVIEGPKACGKTATARQRAASEVLLDVDTDARQAAAIDAGLVLEGATPRLLDEWQVVPELWNHIRRAIDDRREPGQFILTGSAVPADDITRHTGAGRIARLRLRPMSLYELGASTGAVSVAGLFRGEFEGARGELDFGRLVELTAIGGWPGHLSRGSSEAVQANRDYLEEVRRTDIRRVDGVRRDPTRVGRLLRSLARNVATTASVSTMAADTGEADGPLKDHTALEYLAALEQLMAIEDQPAWAPHLRSKSILRKSPKRHFVDPSLAVAAVGATPERLASDLHFFGLLFESLVIRDLRVYGQPLDAEVYHYRDNTGLEVDAVVERPDGRWAAFEIKLGGTQRIEEGAASLLKFADRVDTERSGEPAALGVIVGTGGYAYVRDDGVSIIPVGLLGP